ncbi:hypothetical protein [Oceanobacter mangrovi]|uniref:hypothetical protein n=1 Tax=Oceanobacter mangrovi TaxID=2862510 RepID=UPI001C8E96CC|nr:hypothetical protein [Oceanobacter mangrovi]
MIPNQFRLLLLAATVSALTACGSSDSNSSSDSDEHEHEDAQRLLYTETTSTDINVFDREEEAFELIGQATEAGTTIIRADGGLSAAIVSSTGVQFIDSGLEEHEDEDSDSEEEHEEASIIDALTITRANPVVNMSNYHFAVLNDGTTDLYPVDGIADTTGPTSNISIDGYTQTYPALVLDADSNLYALFDGDSVDVYQDGTATGTSFSCSDLTAVAQADALAVVQCGDAFTYLVTETDSETGDISVSTAAVTPPDGDEFAMQGAGDHVLIYSSSAASLVHAHNDHAHSEDPGVSLDEDQSLCFASLNPPATYLLAVRDDGTSEVIDLDEDDPADPVSITLSNDADSFDCDNLNSGAADDAWLITDNGNSLIYVIDAHDGGSYHLHGTEDLEAGVAVSSVAVLAAPEDEDEE